MKKLLTKIKQQDIYYYKDNEKIVIDRNNKSTYPSGLRGDISELRGDCTDIKGDIDNCELTDKDRERRINIEDLIED